MATGTGDGAAVDVEDVTDVTDVTDVEDVEDFCRVCGYDGDRFHAYGWPTSAICDCCGTEPEVQLFPDLPGSWAGVRPLHTVRGWWLGLGAPWDRPRHRPRDWDLLSQIRNIPEKWRTPPPPPTDRSLRIAARATGGSTGTETVCRICGLAGPVFWSGRLATEITCPCCGCESGIDDLGVPGHWESLHDIRTLRGRWVALGAPWATARLRPADWRLLGQLADLPPEWR